MKWCMILVLTISAWFATAANAQEQSAEQSNEDTTEQASNKQFVSVGWATGGLVSMSVADGEFAGGYLLTGPRFTVQPADHFFFTWGFNYGVAPVTGNHGFVGLVSFEVLATPWLGIDLFPSVVLDWAHDQQTGQVSTGWYGGAGTGVSFFLPNGKCLSPWLFYSHTIGGEGATLSTGLTFIVGL